MKDSLVLHHSAGTSIKPQYESVRAYHNKGANGKWPAGKGIQYAYFIEANGQVIQGRREDEITWHAGAMAWNVRSIGICLAGDFTKQQPTAAQIQALAKLTLDIQTRWGIPDARIYLHKEVRPVGTACPGIDLRPLLFDERKRLMSLKLERMQKAESRTKGSRKARLQRAIVRIMDALGMS